MQHNAKERAKTTKQSQDTLTRSQARTTITIQNATQRTTRVSTPRLYADMIRQAWRTPRTFYRVLDWEFCFDIDAAASEYDTKHNYFFDIALNALHIPQWSVPEKVNWIGRDVVKRVLRNVNGKRKFKRVFCNPGFANLLPWYKKAYEQVSLPPAQRCDVVVVLGLNGSSKAMQFAERYATEIREILPRINFDVPIDPQTKQPYTDVKQSSNAHNNVVCIFRPPMKYNLAHDPLCRKFIWCLPRNAIHTAKEK